MSADRGKLGRSSHAVVRNAWYVLGRSAELGSKPVSRELFDTPIVLFRDANGTARALLDRCAHRNVPLSLGRCEAGQIECAYHGWRFDGEGQCRSVPGLPQVGEHFGRSVSTFAVREVQGLIWVWGEADRTPAGEPFTVPHLEDQRYHSIHYDFEFEATLHATAENILDVPHTAFLHRGLFRGAGKRNRIVAELQLETDRVGVRYRGEPRPGGLVGKLLAPRGGEVQHWDRFIMPCVAQVEYGLGDSSHVVVTSLLTPANANKTLMYTVLVLRLPVASGVVARVAEPLARRIVLQDAEILAAQNRSVQRFGGEQFVSTDLDLLGPQILKLLRRAESGSAPAVPGKEKRVEMDV